MSTIYSRLREFLTLALIGFLPFHAFLVTVGTKLITGPGHAPMTSLALWKEGVLVVIIGIGVIEILKKVNREKQTMKIDMIDVLIVCLIILSLVVTAMTQGDWKLYLFGFKYDFLPLIAFLILRRVEWSDLFLCRA